jgi:hypothetical protein
MAAKSIMESAIPAIKKSRSSARFDALSIALFFLLLILVLLTYRNYGISWDEPIHHNYAMQALRYYTSLFRDASALSAEYHQYYYGAFFEIMCELFHFVVPIGIYESRHLFYAIAGIIGIIGCWKLVRFLVGPAAAFWTALLLALYPSYYGHMFINSIDVAFAALYIWSIYFLLRFLHQFPNPKFGAACKLGLTIGLAMGTRIGGIVLLPYCYLFAALGCFNFFIARNKTDKSAYRSCLKVLLFLLAISAIAYAVMLLFWPYGMSNPLAHTLETLKISSLQTEIPPLDYIPKHLLFKLPEYALLLLGFVVYFAIKACRRKSFAQLQPYFLLAVSAVFPIIYVMYKQVSLYDEIRHLLFIIPPLFCLLGIAFYSVGIRWLKNKGARAVLFPLMAVYFAFHISLMARLHPYEYIYYNLLAGGIRGACQRGYDMDYWGTSYRELVLNFARELRQQYGDRFYSMRFRILPGPPPWCATNYFPPQFMETSDPADADYYLSMTRNMYHKRYAGRECFQVQKMGATLAVAVILNENGMPSNYRPLNK